MNLTELGKSLSGMGLKLLGTAIGGPAGATVADMVAHALGLEDAAPEHIAAAASANLGAVNTLKEMEAANAVELRKIALEGERIRLEDTQSAREMNVENTKTTGKRDINIYVLSYLYVVGFFIATIATTVLVVSGKFPADMPAAASYLLGNLFGALTAGVGAIIQYHFGSNASSDWKTTLLAMAEPVRGLTGGGVSTPKPAPQGDEVDR